MQYSTTQSEMQVIVSEIQMIEPGHRSGLRTAIRYGILSPKRWYEMQKGRRQQRKMQGAGGSPTNEIALSAMALFPLNGCRESSGSLCIKRAEVACGKELWRGMFAEVNRMPRARVLLKNRGVAPFVYCRLYSMDSSFVRNVFHTPRGKDSRS